MKFGEIFKIDGDYTNSEFAEGCCIRIKGGIMLFVQYKNSSDLNPEISNALMTESLLNREYTKVFTRQSLFTTKG